MSSVVPGSLYLVLPVPFRIVNGEMFVEAQAANGLDRWADHFELVTIAAPVIPDAQAQQLAGFVWRSVQSLTHNQRILCQPLPWAYMPGAFLRNLPGTRAFMAAIIAQSEHLQFAIGGLIGDWAAVAAREAIRQNRRFAIHTDRVEHELIRKTAGSTSPLRRAKIAVEAPLIERYHRRIIARCSLGLWHGDDCFRAYAPWCTSGENYLIHDVHTKPADLISDAQLSAKIVSTHTSPTVHLCYAGRLDPMKAPLEWLRAVASARNHGASITATWYGEGPLLGDAQTEAAKLGVQDIVTFPGFLADRKQMLACLRATHALVFTHITPESPRILLEALVSGTPILGYDNAFAVNLLDSQGGGQLVPMHDTEALARLIASLARDREQLATLTTQAAHNGRRFTDAAVFAERSALIQRFA